jgi:hypothetical protein
MCVMRHLYYFTYSVCQHEAHCGFESVCVCVCVCVCVFVCANVCVSI